MQGFVISCALHYCIIASTEQSQVQCNGLAIGARLDCATHPHCCIIPHNEVHFYARISDVLHSEAVPSFT